MALEFHQFGYRHDNYGVLIHDTDSGETACVDAGSRDAKAELGALAETGWTLTQVWITHHHSDHIAGLGPLKAATKCTVYGPAQTPAQSDATPKIQGIDIHLKDGDSFDFAGQSVKVLHTPGHTLDMLNYYLPEAGVVFTGDTLFALGCGRLNEGTHAQMFDSLRRLRALPADTRVYCGHEYTAANAAFAATIDPDNSALGQRTKDINRLRAKSLPTLPTTIGEEIRTNPFLRWDDPAIRQHLSMGDASDLDVFTDIRKRKDRA